MSEKKGLPPIAFVGIGCLVLAIIGVIGMSMLVAKCKNTVEDYANNPEKLAGDFAVMAIKKDPDLDFVSSDSAKRTITYRDKKSGKETTISWKDAKDGKLTVTSGDETTTVDGASGTATIETPEGTTTLNAGGGLEKFPKWIEVPSEISGWRSAMRQERTDGAFNGSVSGKAKLSPDELAALFQKALETGGFERISKTEAPDHAMLIYEDKEKKRSLSITIFKGRGETHVNMGYAQK